MIKSSHWSPAACLSRWALTPSSMPRRMSCRWQPRARYPNASNSKNIRSNEPRAVQHWRCAVGGYQARFEKSSAEALTFQAWGILLRLDREVHAVEGLEWIFGLDGSPDWPDYSAVLRAVASGADTVLVNLPAGMAAGFLKVAQEQGIRDNFKWISDAPAVKTLSPAFLATIGRA